MMILQGSAVREGEKYSMSPTSRQYLHVITLMLCTTFIFQVRIIKLFTLCSRISANFWILLDNDIILGVRKLLDFCQYDNCIHSDKIVNRSTKENDFS